MGPYDSILYHTQEVTDRQEVSEEVSTDTGPYIKPTGRYRQEVNTNGKIQVRTKMPTGRREDTYDVLPTARHRYSVQRQIAMMIGARAYTARKLGQNTNSPSRSTTTCMYFSTSFYE